MASSCSSPRLGDVPTADPRTVGYAGLFGALFILSSVLWIVWGGLDPTTDKISLFVVTVELLGGLTIAVPFGFRFTTSRRVSLTAEVNGVLFGLFIGVIVYAIEYSLLTADYFLSTTQGLALTMIAPAAETMIIVAVYHLFNYHFPGVFWLVWAVPTDIVFATFHWYAYGSRPDFLLLEVILAVGNTLFMYSYQLTRNATVPMMAHFFVNLVPNWGTVYSFIVVWAWLFILLFAAFFFLYYFLGGLFRH